MYKTVVLSLFLFASLSKIWTPNAVTIRKPYVLAEYHDENMPAKLRYEYPSCARKDAADNYAIFSASGPVSKIKYFCYPMEKAPCDKDYGTFMNHYCAFDKSPECGVEGDYNYVMENVVYSSGFEVPCGRNGKGAKLYRVGYDFHLISDKKPFETTVYRFCYDKEREKTLYAEYTILSPDLLDNPDVDDKTFHEEIKTSPFSRKEFGDFSKKIEYFNKFAKESGSQLAYHNLVVPPSHFAMDWWKEPLYHVVNEQILRPQFHTEMNLINKYIRDQAKRKLGEIFIRTGVIDSFDHNYDAAYWWKLIYDERRNYAIAVIIYNLELEDPPNPDTLLIGKKNGERPCHRYGWQDIVPSTIAKFVYCSTPHFFTERYDFTPVETFDLNKLAEEKYAGRARDCQIPQKKDIDSRTDFPAENQRYDSSFQNTAVAVY